jgi:hypothetical protein
MGNTHQKKLSLASKTTVNDKSSRRHSSTDAVFRT